MNPTTASTPRPGAEFRGVRAWEPVERIDVRRDGHRLAEDGFWVVVATFEGRIDAWRCARVERGEPAGGAVKAGWQGPAADTWDSSLGREDYLAGVERIREVIRDGGVYQVNLCRVMSAPLSPPVDHAVPDPVALSGVLARGNPARYASRLWFPPTADAPGAWVVSASPELYLRIDGDRVRSAPIKGTAAPGVDMLDKDVAENIMITDLIRNDLSHVAQPGAVAVPELLGEHSHPGLTHLQSTVEARLEHTYAWTPQMWPALMDGTFPPGSVSGAPKAAALEVIAREERAARGPYCGAIGWVDADTRTAELAVGIRTFWWTPEHGGLLHFGTGAGITWGSDPAGEWAETELKAQRLIALASADRMTA